MKMPTLRRKRVDSPLPGIVGTTRMDTSLRGLLERLQPGDIAVVDRLDLDRPSARELVAKRVAAVVNTSKSISGRYPTLGPDVLLDAGIPLIDITGGELYGRLADGDAVRLDDGTLYKGETAIAEGTPQTRESVERDLDEAREGMSVQLEAFAVNAVDYLRRDRELLLDRVGVPTIRTPLKGRQVVLVVRANGYREDLARLRSYIRESRPVLVGVDAGADALLEVGLTPDLIVGDLEKVSDATLACGAELVAKEKGDRRARLERLGVESAAFTGDSARGASEDLALLLVDTHGADLIVTVGANGSLSELLERGGSGMAASVLTRLVAGRKLVDAESVEQLYRSRVPVWQVVVFLVAGLIAVVVALAATSSGQFWLDAAGARLSYGISWARGLL